MHTIKAVMVATLGALTRADRDRSRRKRPVAARRTPDAAPQLDHVARAPAHGGARAVHEVVIVHGNGPQVGLLALESAADASLTAPTHLVTSWPRLRVSSATGSNRPSAEP